MDVGLSPEIRPQRLRFTGEDLCLNAEQDIWLRTAEHPELLPYRNEEILFSDGTSVLGADNKAAVTVVMTLLANLTATDRHGDIVVAFVPDERSACAVPRRWICSVSPSISPTPSIAANWVKWFTRISTRRRRRSASKG